MSLPMTGSTLRSLARAVRAAIISSSCSRNQTPNSWRFAIRMSNGIAAREGWRLVFEHDHDMPLGVLVDDGGKLRAVRCAVEA